MAKLQIKKSNEAGKVPQPGDLDWGELAINYTDGKLFYKKHGTGTVEQLTTPAPGSGALTLNTGAGATNTSVTIGTGTGFTANSSDPSTYTINIGPSLTSLATLMTGATTGFIKKTGADTYTLDTNTYSTTDTNTTYTLDGQGSTNDIDIQLIAGGSGSGTDSIKLVGSGATTVAWDENAQKITITSSDTVTRLRGTTSGSFTTGDVTLVAGSNVTISQSGNDITIASTDTVTDTTKLPLAGGTMTGAIVFSAATGYNPLQITGGVAGYYPAVQDGNGRINWYWNKAGSGGSPTFEVANEDAIRLKFSTTQAAGSEAGLGVYYAAGGAAGAPITWTEILGAFHNRFQYLGNTIWHAGNDGATSGLDADLLDGNHASAFALSGHAHDYLPLSGGTLTGTLQHAGLVMSAGTGVDQVYTHQQNITLTTAWQDTGVNAAELATGSYIIQVVAVSDYVAGGGHYDEYYTGIMSWFASNTNSTMTDEIVLHRAGHAPNAGTIFLRVARTLGADTDDIKLQIAGTTTNSAAYQYTFKFRRLI